MTIRKDPTGSADPAATIRDWLVERIAARLGISRQEVPVDAYIGDLDIDSADALVLVTELEEWLGRTLDVSEVWHHPTLVELSEHLAGYLEPPRRGPWR